MHMARGFCITLNSITSFLCHQSKSFFIIILQPTEFITQRTLFSNWTKWKSHDNIFRLYSNLPPFPQYASAGWTLLLRVLVCMQSCIAVTRVIFSKYFHQASSPEGGLKKKRLFLCSGSEEGKNIERPINFILHIYNVYGPYATYGVPKLLKILCIANHIYIKFVRRKFCRITFTTHSIQSIQEKACNQNKSWKQ